MDSGFIEVFFLEAVNDNNCLVIKVSGIHCGCFMECRSHSFRSFLPSIQEYTMMTGMLFTITLF